MAAVAAAGAGKSVGQEAALQKAHSDTNNIDSTPVSAINRQGLLSITTTDGQRRLYTLKGVLISCRRLSGKGRKPAPGCSDTGGRLPPKKPAPEGAVTPAQPESRRASATSMLSPSWLSTSSPVSGMSPDVDCDTAILVAIRLKHAVWAVPE